MNSNFFTSSRFVTKGPDQATYHHSDFRNKDRIYDTINKHVFMQCKYFQNFNGKPGG